MPVSKLPVELLSYIFMLSSSGTNTSAAVRTPLILSRVSKHWRDVAQSTPRLWNQIYVTPELFVGNRATHTVDTRHIITCLALSRKCPLDILIDARDDEWDFSEPEIMPVDPDSTYDPFPAPALIGSSLSLLIGHLNRWHSLTILTDTWAPMFMALNLINPTIITRGAPLLESLTLMRCNDFVSFSPEFRPRQLVKPAFLRRRKTRRGPRGTTTTTEKKENAPPPPPPPVKILPRLKHLTLQGVHVDWPALARAIAEDSQVGGLETLSLGSHSLQVRPSRRDFCRILMASKGLRVLSTSGSGPVLLPVPPLPSDGVAAATTTATTAATAAAIQKQKQADEEEDKVVVRLESLQRLVVGYRSLEDARAMFGSIWAPGLKEMVLEDVGHPADTEDVDGNSVLACLSVKREGRTIPTFLDAVEELTLRNVKFSLKRKTLKTTLAGATRLRKMNVENVVGADNVLLAMTPDGSDGDLPCPELESLVVDVGPTCSSSSSSSPSLDATARVGVWFQMAKRLVEERRRVTKGLRDVKISLEHPYGTRRRVVVAAGKKTEAVIQGTFVAVEMKDSKGRRAYYGDGDEDDEDEDEAEDEGNTTAEAEAKAYLPGGTFNDPVFDAYWGGSPGISPLFEGELEKVAVV